MQVQYLPIMSENQSGYLLGKIGHDAHTETLRKFSLGDFFSLGRKSKFLFKSGKRRAEDLMTSVGFGVTRPRTCCFKPNCIVNFNINIFSLVLLL